ncbi:hypothetical protein B0H13DRAFT_1875594 [Mycena leptocephala]|nr:hypothetical protein B0H13DRAFT_1875594 [Mycena leptocephala]
MVPGQTARTCADENPLASLETSPGKKIFQSLGEWKLSPQHIFNYGRFPVGHRSPDPRVPNLKTTGSVPSSENADDPARLFPMRYGATESCFYWICVPAAIEKEPLVTANPRDGDLWTKGAHKYPMCAVSADLACGVIPAVEISRPRVSEMNECCAWQFNAAPTIFRQFYCDFGLWVPLTRSKLGKQPNRAPRVNQHPEYIKNAYQRPHGGKRRVDRKLEWNSICIAKITTILIISRVPVNGSMRICDVRQYQPDRNDGKQTSAFVDAESIIASDPYELIGLLEPNGCSSSKVKVRVRP